MRFEITDTFLGLLALSAIFEWISPCITGEVLPPDGATLWFSLAHD